MIKIICVGKIKEKFFQQAIEEYQKRLSRYTKLEIVELEDVNYDVASSLAKEKEAILRQIKENDYVITLDIEGNMVSSEELSGQLEKGLINYPNLTFIIGGSNGLHETIKERSNYSLSFSKMTFPHQLFRIILLEQLYRSFKIMKNESYHK